MAEKCFVIDVGRCTGCYNCQLACKDEHAGNDFRPIAAPQPLTGQFWCAVDEHPGGTIPKLRIHYIAHLCNHCKNAACMAACSSGSIYRRDDGLVIIDPQTCTGCRKCVQACPYNAVFFNETLHIAQKCTGCAHLLDAGYTQPRCAEACPTDAMRFGTEDELAELISGAVTLKPESGCGPRVYYRNIPGRFIGATVYDPVQKEVIIGAECTLTGEGCTFSAKTDDFGDFWFRDLPEAVFDLEITASGYRTIRFSALSTSADLNLGDLPMQPSVSNV